MKLFRNIAICAALILAACAKQDPGTAKPENPVGNPSIEVPENIDVVQEGISGTYPVTIKDADGWDPCVEKTGFISHAEFDAANSVVKYNIGPNNTTEELRSSIKFILKRSGQNDVVAITSFLQAGKPGVSGYKKVTSTPSDWAGTYLLVAKSGNYNYAANGKVSSDNWLGKTDVEVENNIIQITEATETVEAVISKLGDNYTIKFEDGYLGSENDNSGIMIGSSAGDSEFFWNFSINSEGITIFLPNVGNRILCYNGSGFRAYNSATGVKCSLYKKEGSAPTPVPVVTTGEVSDITKTSATLHGSCENMSSVICSFNYGTSKTNLSQTVQAPAAGKTFSANVSGLAAGTKYYFQAEVQTGTNKYSGAIGEFTTAEEGGGGGGGTGLADYGWYELPAQTDKDGNGIDDNNPDYYYSHTFRADASSIRNFSCCYSKSKIHPVWVAAPFHKCYKGSSGRNDSYKDDPNIHCTQAAKWSGYTRGHMVGSSDRTVSVPTNKQAFYHSNIGAQLSAGFNTGGGRWNKLEDFVDGKWCSDTLYMVNGCIFEEWGGVSPKTVAGSSIPTAYYKAMLRTKKGNTGKSLKNCTADEIMCVAFIIAHKSYATNIEPTSADMYSITELEALTGLTFFVNVPQAPKSTYKASDWGL